MDQLALFDAAPTTIPRRTVPVGSSKPRWRKYNQKAAARPHQCDYCVLNCHTDPAAPIPRKARYIRSADGEQWYLCLQHANDQRAVDGLTLLDLR